MKGARQGKKKIEARVLQAAYSALSRHKFVGGTILCDYSFLSLMHTKGSSASDYMNIV